MDRSEEITGLRPLALIAPETRKITGRTQLPEFSVLPLRYRERVAIATLRRSVLVDRQQQHSSLPMHFGFGPALLGTIDQLGCFVEPIKSFFRVPRQPVQLRKDREEKWNY